MNKYEDLVEDIRKEFPNFKILNKKDSLFIQRINRLLSFLLINKNSFMSDYTTTIGHTSYVPDNWALYSEYTKYVILRHERIHLRQAKKYTSILFSTLYLLVFFPVKFAYFRTKFEKEAYEESIKATLDYLNGDKRFLTPEYKKYICDQFTTSNYGWMWYSRSDIEKWYDNFIKSL